MAKCFEIDSSPRQSGVPALFLSYTFPLKKKKRKTQNKAEQRFCPPSMTNRTTGTMTTSTKYEWLNLSALSQASSTKNEAAARLLQTVSLLERAIGASSCGITITDMRDASQPLIFVNAAFERITGYSCEEVIGKNCRFLQGPDRQQPALVELRAALKQGTDCSVNLQNYRKDGTPFWNELILSPVLMPTAHLPILSAYRPTSLDASRPKTNFCRPTAFWNRRCRSVPEN